MQKTLQALQNLEKNLNEEDNRLKQIEEKVKSLERILLSNFSKSLSEMKSLSDQISKISKIERLERGLSSELEKMQSEMEANINKRIGEMEEKLMKEQERLINEQKQLLEAIQQNRTKSITSKEIKKILNNIDYELETIREWKPWMWAIAGSVAGAVLMIVVVIIAIKTRG